MIHHTTCTVTDPWASLPRLLECGHERRVSPVYERVSKRCTGLRYSVFQYTLSGCGEFTDALGRHTVPAGHGFLLRHPDPEVSWRLPADARQHWEFAWMIFAGGGSEALVDELVARHGHIHQLGSTSPNLLRLRRLVAADHAAITIAAPDGAALVNGLLLDLAAQRPEAASNQQSAALVQRTLEIMRSRASVPAGVGDLAQILQVSREHLSRAFRRHLGRSPLDCLTEERIQRACLLLKSTTHSNDAIAKTLQLSSAGQFVRSFRKLMGITPKRYREWHDAPLITAKN
jgi:AraC-like DNA-binding protein